MAKSELEILIKARNQAKAEFDRLNKQVTGLQGSTGGLGGKLKTLDAGLQKLTGVSLTAGGAIGIASMAVKKMYEYSQVAIKASSDLAETESKVGVVFGDQADAMLRWGESAAEAMGMSSNEALAAAGTYGNLFRAMGIGVDVSAEMSQNLVQLASDLASFNNMNPDEVLDKLRAGLSGEVEPLRSLGVNLNQALIQQEALNLGIWDGVGAINAAQKAQASYSLILKQTTLAQGDFERTSEGLANQQRILDAAQEDLAATIGEYLLPTQTALVETKADLTIQLTDYVRGLKDERDQIERLGLVYDQHLGYMRDGVLLTAEQVNEMKRADRANQAWTASLNAQAEAYYALNPEMEIAVQNYSDLEAGINDVNVLMKDYTKELLFNQAAAGLDADASILLAEKMGLIDPTTSAAMDRLGNFRQMLAEGKITIEEYTSLVAGLDKSIRGLPESKDIHIVVKGEITDSAYDAMAFAGRGTYNILTGPRQQSRAGGGPASGLTWVGEQGPELVNLPQGSHVYSAQQSARMGGAVIHFYYSPAVSLSDKTEVYGTIKPMLEEILRD